jgi:hypothetical protein
MRDPTASARGQDSRAATDIPEVLVPSCRRGLMRDQPSRGKYAAAEQWSRRTVALMGGGNIGAHRPQFAIAFSCKASTVT